jgi:hypothetical protein
MQLLHNTADSGSKSNHDDDSKKKSIDEDAQRLPTGVIPVSDELPALEPTAVDSDEAHHIDDIKSCSDSERPSDTGNQDSDGKAPSDGKLNVHDDSSIEQQEHLTLCSDHAKNTQALQLANVNSEHLQQVAIVEGLKWHPTTEHGGAPGAKEQQHSHRDKDRRTCCAGNVSC